MKPFKLLVQRYPLMMFFSLTFTISWLPARMIAVVPSLPMLIFATGPVVAVSG